MPGIFMNIRKVLRTWVREHSASYAKVVEFGRPAEIVPGGGGFWRFWEARVRSWKVLLSKMKKSRGFGSGGEPKTTIFIVFFEYQPFPLISNNSKWAERKRIKFRRNGFYRIWVRNQIFCQRDELHWVPSEILDVVNADPTISWQCVP